MNYDDLIRKGFVCGPAGWVKAPTVVAEVYNSQPKYHARKTLECDKPNEKGSPKRIIVRITRFATRFLDLDNGYGGCVPLVNAIRYSGLISNDDPGTIDLQFCQEKVKSKAQQGTMIELIQP
jgi:hypothetical protein